MQFPCQSLGGKLDRRKRITDFVRQTFRHFAPCGLFLRPHQDGNVINHHHHAVIIVFRQNGGFAQQDSGIIGRGVFDLDGFVAIGAFINGGKHIGQQGLLRRFAVPLMPVTAPQRHQRNAQNLFGGLVKGFQTAIGIQSNHACSQTFQHAFQIMACCFFAQTVALVCLFGNR